MSSRTLVDTSIAWERVDLFFETSEPDIQRFSHLLLRMLEREERRQLGDCNVLMGLAKKRRRRHGVGA